MKPNTPSRSLLALTAQAPLYALWSGPCTRPQRAASPCSSSTSQTVTASLAADHRVSDGHRGAQFLGETHRLLQHPEIL